MIRAEAEAVVAFFRAKAVDILRRDGAHAPLMVLYPDAPGAPPVLLALGGLMASDRAKAAGMGVVRAAVRMIRPAGVVTVMEAWVSPRAKMVGGDEPGLGGHLKPRDDPDRREALTVTWEFRAAEGRWAGMATQFFHHVDGGIALDEAEEWIEGPDRRLTGRFCGLLAEAPADSA